MTSPALAGPLERVPSAAPLTVCVLGMHRSGTSVVAALLERFGVYMGAPHVWLPTLPENPLGYWEHRGIKELNEELLHRLGGSWHTLPPLPAGWQDAATLDDLRDRARAIVRADLAGHPCWGWKDPRACVLLPFWKPLLPPMRYVLCVRHPIDVARSLDARDDLPFDHALRLWLAHQASALVHTEADPRALVHYEALLTNPHAAVAELARLLDHAGPLPEVADLVVGDLQHHRSASAGAEYDGQVPPPIRAQYDALLGMPQPRTSEAWAALTGIAARTVRDQLAFDEERNPDGWFIDYVRSLGAEPGMLDRDLGHPRPVGALRQLAREFLAQRPALGGLYRQARRRFRRALRLGP